MSPPVFSDFTVLGFESPARLCPVSAHSNKYKKNEKIGIWACETLRCPLKICQRSDSKRWDSISFRPPANGGDASWFTKARSKDLLYQEACHLMIGALIS